MARNMEAIVKCVHKKQKDYRRVSDDEAAELVSKGYTYCSKSEYKENMALDKKGKKS